MRLLLFVGTDDGVVSVIRLRVIVVVLFRLLERRDQIGFEHALSDSQAS